MHISIRPSAVQGHRPPSSFPEVVRRSQSHPLPLLSRCLDAHEEMRARYDEMAEGRGDLLPCSFASPTFILIRGYELVRCSSTLCVIRSIARGRATGRHRWVRRRSRGSVWFSIHICLSALSLSLQRPLAAPNGRPIASMQRPPLSLSDLLEGETE